MLVPADDLDVAVAMDNGRIALVGLKPGAGLYPVSSGEEPFADRDGARLRNSARLTGKMK